MNDAAQITIPAGALRDMTVEQLKALQEHIVGEKCWQHVESLHISGGDYLGVHLPGFFVGIEKDGYTHS